MDLLNVTDIFKMEGGDPVLEGISFSLQSHQKLAIAGGSGSGKTTLLKIIGGLIQPDRGEVRFEGVKVKGPYETLIPGHPGIAYLSQHFELRNNYRVEELLLYGNVLEEAAAYKIFEICRISHLLQRWSDELSGGERQRIALGKLLVTSPRLLLLDEPFSNLDPIVRGILRSVIADLGEQMGLTCLLVSHDPMDTLSWADEIMILQKGQIVQKDNPQKIYQNPVNEYAAALFGSYNLLPAREGVAEALLGNAPMSLPYAGARLFLRPEDIDIQLTVGPDALNGRVDAVRFAGSAFEIEVIVMNGRLTIRTPIPFATGEVVSLAVEPGGSLWFLD